MLILVAVTVTYSIKSGLLTKATETKFKAKLSKYKEEVAIYINNQMVEDSTYDYTKLYANKSKGIDGEKDIDGGVKAIIPSITTEDLELLEIHAGKLVEIEESEKRTLEYDRWVQELGIELAEKYSDSDIEIINSSKDIYAWYDEGTLFFSKNAEDMPKDGYGNIKGKSFDESTKGTAETYTPWKDKKSNITAVTFLTEIIPTDLAYWFQNCTGLKTINNIKNLKTNLATNMRAMFHYCKVLTSLDVSEFNTSKVTNMRDVFSECYLLTELNVTNFDTSKVTNMVGMFYGCKALKKLDASNFNTSNVTDMSWMFSGCSSLVELNVSNWNTSNVEDMSYMFQALYVVQELDVSSFDTSKVTNMNRMFCLCSKIKKLDVSNWNTSKVKDMSYMFAKCESLKELDTSNWSTANLEKNEYMFYCVNL